MACRRKKISKKPFDIQVSFKNAQGPVIVGSSLKDIINGMTGTAGEVGNQRTEYGAQRTPPNNEETIQQASPNIQEILQ